MILLAIVINFFTEHSGTQAPLKQGQVVTVNAEIVQQQPQQQQNQQQQTCADSQTQSQWGENRLADVVKGTAKSKSNSKEASSGPESDSPRAGSPQHANQAIQTGLSRQGIFVSPTETKDAASNAPPMAQSAILTLTPPNSPEK